MIRLVFLVGVVVAPLLILLLALLYGPDLEYRVEVYGLAVAGSS